MSVESEPLEDKLGKLLGALRANKQQTGSDEWAGKPAQAELTLVSQGPPDANEMEIVEVITPSQDRELDSLMMTYLRSAAAVRAEPARDQPPPERPKTEYDDMSLPELLAKLDEVV